MTNLFLIINAITNYLYLHLTQFNLKYLLILTFSLCSTFLYSQTYTIVDTIISSHSKYNWIDQGIKINTYYLYKKIT